MENFPKMTENIMESIAKSKNGEIKDNMLNSNIMCTLVLMFSSQTKRKKEELSKDEKALAQAKEEIEFKFKIQIPEEEKPQNDSNYYIPLSRIPLSLYSPHFKRTKVLRSWTTHSNNNSSDNITPSLNAKDFIEDSEIFTRNDIDIIKVSSCENEIDFYELPIQPFRNDSGKEKEDELLTLLTNIDEMEIEGNSQLEKKNIDNWKIKGNNTIEEGEDMQQKQKGIKEIPKQLTGFMGLKEKLYMHYIKHMNQKYIVILRTHFDNLYKQSLNPFLYGENEIDNAMFLKLFKQFILKLGVASKKLFNETLRALVYSKKSLTFDEFIQSMKPLLKLKASEGIIKFKFLIGILAKNINQSYISMSDMQTFLEFLKCKDIYEGDICEDLATNLIKRYTDINSNIEKENAAQGLFDISKLLITLDTFYLD